MSSFQLNKIGGKATIFPLLFLRLIDPLILKRELVASFESANLTNGVLTINLNFNELKVWPYPCAPKKIRQMEMGAIWKKSFK